MAWFYTLGAQNHPSYPATQLPDQVGERPAEDQDEDGLEVEEHLQTPKNEVFSVCK